MERTENELSKIIVNIAYDYHVKIGPGLLESVYEEIMAFELTILEIPFTRQEVIPIIWKGMEMRKRFRADIIVQQDNCRDQIR